MAETAAPPLEVKTRANVCLDHLSRTCTVVVHSHQPGCVLGMRNATCTYTSPKSAGTGGTSEGPGDDALREGL